MIMIGLQRSGVLILGLEYTNLNFRYLYPMLFSTFELLLVILTGIGRGESRSPQFEPL